MSAIWGVGGTGVAAGSSCRPAALKEAMKKVGSQRREGAERRVLKLFNIKRA
jgi:hypothetical protein